MAQYFFLLFCSVSYLETLLASARTTVVERKAEGASLSASSLHSIPVRKCCPPNHYYSTSNHECEQDFDEAEFFSIIRYYLGAPENDTIVTKSRKIDACPDTFEKPRIAAISNPFSYVLLDDGQLYDYSLDHAFDSERYCLEMVGNSSVDVNLVLAYCLGPQRVLPKCCPENHYFDFRIHNCSLYFNVENEGGIFSFLDDSNTIIYTEELSCHDMPVKISLHESSIHEDMLCLTRSDHCYSPYEFCVDDMLSDEGTSLEPSAFVCPINFWNKCCPNGHSLSEFGCVRSEDVSPKLAHLLKYSRYQVKSLKKDGSHCTPITIEDNAESGIVWTIDSYGFALISKNSDTVRTRNFCIDDLLTDNDVLLPVIKVCSEEIQIYHEVDSLESEKTLGKCCPESLLYRSGGSENVPTCEKKPESVRGTLREELSRYTNVSQLVFANFPECSPGELYHKYELRRAFYDHAQLTEDGKLSIIRKDNNCRVKESTVESDKFCVDLMMKNGETKPIAIMCAAAAKTFHEERNVVVVSLVGVSCAALLSAFLLLIFMRVRRGMVTTKKIKTLAGKILTSYVLCQLIGFFALGIGYLVDFKEDINKCFVLAGFLMFFMISAFCWNTSICLEGLLLTMHVKMSDFQRYLCHSLWAWGVPGCITAAAIARDLKRDSLPCDSITPKIGVERCFFSDATAQLVYFYLPISVTVVINGILLVSAKVLRKKKLKMLEKDPNRIRKHENLQQVLSIKSLKSKLRGEPSVKPLPYHTGLRKHDNRNVWMECLKLVLWSGTTWLMEITGTLVTMYNGRSRGEWYNYLWYLPVGFNCLRGLGIFTIIALNAESKLQLLRTARSFSSSFNATVHKFWPTMRFSGGAADAARTKSGVRRTDPNGRTVPLCLLQDGAHRKHEPTKKTRSTSISTIVSSVSSSTLGPPPSAEPAEGQQQQQQPPTRFFHSISQTDCKLPPLEVTFEDAESDSEPIFGDVEDGSGEVFWKGNWRRFSEDEDAAPSESDIQRGQPLERASSAAVCRCAASGCATPQENIEWCTRL